MAAATPPQSMSDKITATIDGKALEYPVVVGSEGERAIDVTKLRDVTGYITLDPGYRNTGSCTSDITFIDAEAGVLRYRGYPIEDLAEESSFLETAQLLINGKLPTGAEQTAFLARVAEHTAVGPRLLNVLKGFPQDASPMAMLSACINALCGYHPEVLDVAYEPHFDRTSAMLIAKVRTLAAAIYRHSIGQEALEPADIPGVPKPQYYTAKFLQMMFGQTTRPEVARALDLIFLLHADHEQNCSASTCRMVGSSHANLFASCAAAVCALWGPLHGGANVEIMNQLEQIHSDGIDPDDFLAGVKAKKYRLFGFGHPIYRNYDPRAKILKASAEEVLGALNVNDPLLNIARRLEAVALKDDYFVSRKLYPNVDFYSGIIMRAIGIPTEMFTVMFAVGRMPGWIAQWKEVRDQKGKIYRPRQIYTGPTGGQYAPIDARS
ncbi:MAG TPA: citrate synthase [Tepidisphaeraceae bacterium]|jgi:citrate synthase